MYQQNILKYNSASNSIIMKITQLEILDEIRKCNKDIKYLYQKYYIHGIEKPVIIKANSANESTLLNLAAKLMNRLPDFLKTPKKLT